MWLKMNAPNERTLLLRRAIIFALHAYFVPKRLDDLELKDVKLIDLADPALLREAWKSLLECGLIKAVPAYGEDVCELSANVALRLGKGDALRDMEYLYGVAAITFREKLEQIQKELNAPS